MHPWHWIHKEVSSVCRCAFSYAADLFSRKLSFGRFQFIISLSKSWFEFKGFLVQWNFLETVFPLNLLGGIHHRSPGKDLCTLRNLNWKLTYFLMILLHESCFGPTFIYFHLIHLFVERPKSECDNLWVGVCKCLFWIGSEFRIVGVVKEKNLCKNHKSKKKI